MQVNDNKVTFNVFNPMKYPNDGVEQCHAISESLKMKLIEEEEGKEEDEQKMMNEDEEDCQFVGREKEEAEPLMLH